MSDVSPCVPAHSAVDVNEDVGLKANLQVVTKQIMANQAASNYPADLFDTAQLLEIKDIVGPDFAALLQQLVGNIHAGIATMHAACVANSAEELRHAAHKLKGSSATVGVKQVAELCLQLEILGKSGSVVGALELLDELVRAYSRAKPYLDECAASS